MSIYKSDDWIKYGYFKKIDDRTFVCNLCGTKTAWGGMGQHMKAAHKQEYYKHRQPKSILDPYEFPNFKLCFGIPLAKKLEAAGYKSVGKCKMDNGKDGIVFRRS